jgi:cytochrome c biogenesis protein CcdA
MGSAKRALKYGLLYCFVVFITYFLAGLGLFKVIQSLTGVIYYVHLIIGLLSVCLGLIQVIDIIFPGKFVSLRIPQSTKPLIEKLSEKTTIPAVMLLGFLVSLFELPCTGGVYIAILATMSINKTFAIGYLLLYNFIFVLPLIAITLFIYKGTKPEVLQKWTSDEKIWMKLSSGLVMLGLGVYLLWSL